MSDECEHPECDPLRCGYEAAYDRGRARGRADAQAEHEQQVREAVVDVEGSHLFRSAIDGRCYHCGGTFDAHCAVRVEQQVREAVLREREACAKCIPTTWLDSLLTGKDAVIPSDWSNFDPEHLQRLLISVQARIRARSTSQGEGTPQPPATEGE